MTINFDQYKILKECKGNKSNRIFLVEEISTGEPMVLKIIKIQELEKQVREIEVHKKLSHKFVIKLIDYDITRSYIVLLIEYAKYGDLFTHLPRLMEIPEKNVLKFYYQVVQSIHYLHENGFVHRDIKPENVLITRKFSPRLADFGTSAKTDFIKNTFCGTLEYMAPEILQRFQQTNKIDIWALGILLYEITHNSTPFKNESVPGIKAKLETQTIKFKPDLNPKIKDLILKILKFNPILRPTTQEIMEDSLFEDFRPKKVDLQNFTENYSRESFQEKVNERVQNRLREYKISIEQGIDPNQCEIEKMFSQQSTKSSMNQKDKADIVMKIEKGKEILKNELFSKVDESEMSKVKNRNMKSFQDLEHLKMDECKMKDKERICEYYPQKCKHIFTCQDLSVGSSSFCNQFDGRDKDMGFLEKKNKNSFIVNTKENRFLDEFPATKAEMMEKYILHKNVSQISGHLNYGKQEYGKNDMSFKEGEFNESIQNQKKNGFSKWS